MTEPRGSRRSCATLRVRHAPAPRRPATRSEHRRPGGADLPDRQLCVRGSRVGGCLLQPPGVREHVLADHEPDGRGLRGADRKPRGRRRSGRLLERNRSSGGRALHAAAARRTTSSRHRHCMAAASTSSSTCSESSASSSPGSTPTTSPRGAERCATTRRPSLPRRSETPPARCSTSRLWRGSPTGTDYR